MIVVFHPVRVARVVQFRGSLARAPAPGVRIVVRYKNGAKVNDVDPELGQLRQPRCGGFQRAFRREGARLNLVHHAARDPFGRWPRLPLAERSRRCGHGTRCHRHQSRDSHEHFFHRPRPHFFYLACCCNWIKSVPARETRTRSASPLAYLARSFPHSAPPRGRRSRARGVCSRTRPINHRHDIRSRSPNPAGANARVIGGRQGFSRRLASGLTAGQIPQQDRPGERPVNPGFTPISHQLAPWRTRRTSREASPA